MDKLYWMTWDEVPEGMEVWLFDKVTHDSYGIQRLEKSPKGNLRVAGHDDVPWTSDETFYSQYNYILAPQHKPKPNSWDEYIDDDGNFDSKWVHLNKHTILTRSKDWRVAADWIYSLLPEEPKDG